MEEVRNTHRSFVKKREGKISLGRPRCTLEDNAKTDVGGGGKV